MALKEPRRWWLQPIKTGLGDGTDELRSAGGYGILVTHQAPVRAEIRLIALFVNYRGPDRERRRLGGMITAEPDGGMGTEWQSVMRDERPAACLGDARQLILLSATHLLLGNLMRLHIYYLHGMLLGSPNFSKSGAAPSHPATASCINV